MSYAFAFDPFLLNAERPSERAAPPPFTMRVAGPPGGGKTAFVGALCRALRQRWRVAAVVPRKDVAALRRGESLGVSWVASVEEGGVEAMLDARPDLLVVEGAPARVDIVVAVLPVCLPEIMLADPLFFQAHLLIVNKSDLATELGVSLERLAREIRAHRGDPFFFVQCENGLGLSPVLEWVLGAYSSQSTSLAPMVR